MKLTDPQLDELADLVAARLAARDRTLAERPQPAPPQDGDDDGFRVGRMLAGQLGMRAAVGDD